MANYLDSTGLAHLWSKIKAAIAAHKATVTQTVAEGTEIAEVDGTKIYAPSGGGSTTLTTKIKTTAITIPEQQLKDEPDSNLLQPIFLQITCDDTFNYACFAQCYAYIDKGVMRVTVNHLWGQAYKRVFGQSTATLREILPFSVYSSNVPFNTLCESFTVPATLVSDNVYEVSGNATFGQFDKRGTYVYREYIVPLS